MDKKLLGLVLAFFVTFTLFTVAVIFQRPLTQAIRATEENSPSGANSLIFAWPLTEKADGRTQVEVNVFVRSNSNKPVPKKTVSVSSSLGNVQPAEAVSDQAGKTSFMVTSTTPGIAQLSAVIDKNISLQKPLSIKFE